MRCLIPTLIAGLSILPVQAEEPAMTPADRDAFRAEVRAYLLDHPEVLIEAMEILQVREEEAALQREAAVLASRAETLFFSPDDWVGGNPDGDVVLVEFIDYRCGYCRKAYDEVETLVKTDGNIRFVVKEFPILGEGSMLSAQFAIAVLQLHGNAAYASVHDALIKLRGEPTTETLGRLAQDLGYQPDAILDRMNTPPVMAVIQANYELAEMLDISGTPAFVMPDTVLRGYVPLEGMRDYVADERAGIKAPASTTP